MGYAAIINNEILNFKSVWKVTGVTEIVFSFIISVQKINRLESFRNNKSAVSDDEIAVPRTTLIISEENG